MSVQTEFEKQFENEEYEMLMLVQAECNGAECIDKNTFRPSINFLASVDLRTGELCEEKGRIEWLFKREKNEKGWGYEFEQFGIYKIVVKKCICQAANPNQILVMSNRYMLIDVLEENVINEQLKTLKEYYSKPVSIENELGLFRLDREFSWFEGLIDWNGIEATVYLETDEEDGNTAENAIKSLENVVGDLVDNDLRYRKFAAQKLLSIANEWLSEEEEDAEEITEEEFVNRMKISEIIVSPDGSLSMMYNDGDLFFGHIIEILVETDGEILSANIAG